MNKENAVYQCTVFTEVKFDFTTTISQLILLNNYVVSIVIDTLKVQVVKLFDIHLIL